MASAPINPTQITPPRVAFIDERTGAISREWFRFFLSLQSSAETSQDAATLSPSTESLVQVWSAIQDLSLAPREEIVIPTASGGGVGVTLTTVEVNVGSVPKSGGTFTIAGAALTVGKPVLINQAVGPYTGKGTLPDEAEMDQVNVAASVTDAATITAYWSSARRVKGNFKFNYQVSA